MPAAAGASSWCDVGVAGYGEGIVEGEVVEDGESFISDHGVVSS